MNKEYEFEKLRKLAKEESKENEKAPKESQATKIVHLLKNTPSLKFFCDDKEEIYVSLPIQSHTETLLCESKAFRRWVAREHWNIYQSAPSAEAIKSALSVLSSEASFGDKNNKLSIRVAKKENIVWYDLSNAQWQSVRISPFDWEVTDGPPKTFKRLRHQKSQVLPTKEENLKKILDFVNISDEKSKLLLLVYIVSCFIPGFPHPALFVHGTQGTAKSSLAKILKTVIDPSATETSEMPKSLPELLQLLSHHWFINFDNLSRLSQERSDILCKAITGTGFSKRSLYSDDEDFIYVLKSCITLNGISLPATSPDLLERGIILELERIPDEKRKTEEEIQKNLEKALPEILGGIFSTVSKALSLRNTVHLEKKPRMADFVEWGCAIARAIGYTQKEFLNAYTQNTEEQNDRLLDSDPIALSLSEFLEGESSWKGTPSKLYEGLKESTESIGLDMGRYSGFPKNVNHLMMKIRRLQPNLSKRGIEIRNVKEDRKRIVIIEKQSEDEQNVREVFGDHLPRDDRDNGDDTLPSF